MDQPNAPKNDKRCQLCKSCENGLIPAAQERLKFVQVPTPTGGPSTSTLCHVPRPTERCFYNRTCREGTLCRRAPEGCFSVCTARPPRPKCWPRCCRRRRTQPAGRSPAAQPRRSAGRASPATRGRPPSRAVQAEPEPVPVPAAPAPPLVMPAPAPLLWSLPPPPPPPPPLRLLPLPRLQHTRSTTQNRSLQLLCRPSLPPSPPPLLPQPL